MNLNFFILPASAFLLLISCRKDPVDNPGELSGRVIHISHSDTVVSIGRGGVFTKKVDVDGDGQGDLEFKVDAWSQVSGAGWSTLSMVPSNENFQISTYATTDTSFLSVSFARMDPTYWQKKVAINIIRTYTCTRINPDDSIMDYSSSVHPMVYTESDRGVPGGNWLHEELYLRTDSWFGIGISTEKVNQDTIWLSSNKRKTDCHSFPGQAAYLGLRKIAGGKEKLGWVKVIITPGKILIQESELQR